MLSTAPAVRPRLRGASHAVAAVASIPVGIWLIGLAPSPGSRVVIAIYAVALTAMFAVSAAYHLGRWSAPSRRAIKAADHVTIYCFIPASYGPLAVLVFPGPVAAVWLGVLWTGAIVGSVVKVRMLDRLGGPADVLYGVIGGSVVLVVPALVTRLGAGQLALLLGGVAFYGLSALSLRARRPDPWPRTFGYHEWAHLCIVAGAASHVAFNATLLGWTGLLR